MSSPPVNKFLSYLIRNDKGGIGSQLSDDTRRTSSANRRGVFCWRLKGSMGDDIFVINKIYGGVRLTEIKRTARN